MYGCTDRANLAPETFSNLNLDYYLCKKNFFLTQMEAIVLQMQLEKLRIRLIS